MAFTLSSNLPKDKGTELTLYSLDELYGLFQLSSTPELWTEEQMKVCKKQVLMMHPDKSRLDPSYFLFYKQAFGLILEHFQDAQKIDQEVRAGTYQEFLPQEDSQLTAQIQSQLGKLDPKDFNAKFNQAFESLVGQDGLGYQPPSSSSQDWWKQGGDNEDDNAVDKMVREDIHIEKTVDNVSELNSQFEALKKQQREDSSLSLHRGFQEMVAYGGSLLYGKGKSDSTALLDRGNYISSDFVLGGGSQKLAFDDIRRVHRDASMLMVSEEDYDASKRIQSLEELQKMRDQEANEIQYVENPEMLLKQQKEDNLKRVQQQAFEDRKKTMENESKGKSLLAQFLMLF